MEKNRNTFKGSIGFVLAAAGSAVGLGNIWRFPYLASKDGGGIFVFVYLILAVTFGFALLTAEVAIGRKTKQGPLTAYSKLKSGWKPLGVLSCLVPLIIMPYYCVIGGWVLKYLLVFITGEGSLAAADSYFSSFITAQWEPILLFMIFLFAVSLIVFNGVNKGIEATSKIIMPVLLILVIAISIFSLTLKHSAINSETNEVITRTGLQGLKIYLVPNFDGMTIGKFLTVVVDAMGQLFYSLSIAMGIMVAYGSYVHDDANIVKSVNQIEIFDSAVAVLAGIMIIPAVVVFMGEENMAAGPSLMFVILPKVFAAMGKVGVIIGIMFFALVLFAAITSAVSVMEAIVSSIIDQFHLSRPKAVLIEAGIALIAGIFVCLGYNKLYFEFKLPNGSVGQILDIMDYISNNFMMPIVAILTCVLVGWVIKTESITDEITKNGEKFSRKWLFNIMIKYVAPVLLFVLFLQSVGILRLK